METFKDTENKTPLIFILTPGADPREDVLKYYCKLIKIFIIHYLNLKKKLIFKNFLNRIVDNYHM